MLIAYAGLCFSYSAACFNTNDLLHGWSRTGPALIRGTLFSEKCHTFYSHRECGSFHQALEQGVVDKLARLTVIWICETSAATL